MCAQERVAAASAHALGLADAPALSVAVTRVERLFAAQHVLLEAAARVPALVAQLTPPHAEHAAALAAWRSAVCAVLASVRCGKDLLYLASLLVTRLTLLSAAPLPALCALLDAPAAPLVVASVAHTALLRAAALLAAPSDLFAAAPSACVALCSCSFSSRINTSAPQSLAVCAHLGHARGAL